MHEGAVGSHQLPAGPHPICHLQSFPLALGPWRNPGEKQGRNALGQLPALLGCPRFATAAGISRHALQATLTASVFEPPHVLGNSLVSAETSHVWLPTHCRCTTW
jgi:hypothetical protein